MKQELLIRELITRSSVSDWREAKKEWLLESVQQLERGEDSETCLCGHNPIRELCYISNRVTGKVALVGNCCVRQFLGLPSTAIFKSLNKVAADDSRSLNPRALELLRDRKVIGSVDFENSIATWRKRKHSDSLLALRRQVNAQALAYFRRKGRSLETPDTAA